MKVEREDKILLKERFWRSKLTSAEQADYDILCRIAEHRSTSTQEFSNVSGETAMRVCLSVYNDNPEFYYAASTMPPIYVRVDDAAFQTALQGLCSYVSTFSGAYKQILALKDYLASAVEYDFKTMSRLQRCTTHGQRQAVIRTSAAHAFTAYGALVNKTAVCDGIARAAAYVLKLLRIPCIVVCGKLNGVDHAWNVVQINGKNYHLDITSDLCREELFYRRTYNFFLLTDAEIKKTHSFSKILLLDSFDCNTSYDSYFEQSGLVFDDMNKLRKYAMSGPYRDVLAFKYSGSCSHGYVNKLLENAAARRSADGNTVAASVSYKSGRFFAAFKPTAQAAKRDVIEI